MIYVIIVLIILIIIFITLNIISCIKYDETEYVIENNKIPSEFNGFKMLLLTDIHNRKINDKLLLTVKKYNPDIILLGGDMITGNQGNRNFIKLLSKLNNKEVYYVYGNHEEACSKKEIKKIKKAVVNNNINMINNKKITLKRKNSHINLYGFCSKIRYYNYKKKLVLKSSDIEEILGKPKKEDFNMLLSHNPLFYRAYGNYDLVLSGHVHGGIVRFGSNGLLSPEHKFFPKYSSGVNKINNTTLVVSRGIGFGSLLKLRINNPSEAVIITLKKSNK